MQRLVESPVILLTLASLFWAGNFIAGRAIAGEMPPQALALYRTLLALVILLPFVYRDLQRYYASLRQHWKILLLLSTTGVAGFSSSSYQGLQLIEASNAVLLAAINPLIILLLSWAWLGIRMQSMQLFGVAVSLIGVAAIVSRGDINLLLDLRFHLGDLWIFIAVLSWSIYSILLRWRPADLPWHVFLTAQVIGSLVTLVPAFLLETQYSEPWTMDLSLFGAIAYASIFTLILAYMCWAQAIRQVGANYGGQFLNLIPVFGVVLSVLILGEVLQAYHVFGMGLVIGGIILATYRRVAE